MAMTALAINNNPSAEYVCRGFALRGAKADRQLTAYSRWGTPEIADNYLNSPSDRLSI
jgi:hypothetical protein